VGGLSGGNQQKVVIGKSLMTAPTVVMLENPPAASTSARKLEVYELIIASPPRQGRDPRLERTPELMGMGDRIIMLREGRVGGGIHPRRSHAGETHGAPRCWQHDER